MARNTGFEHYWVYPIAVRHWGVRMWRINITKFNRACCGVN